MTRSWDEFAAAVFDVVPPQTLLLLMLLLAGLTGALWYWFPAWVPRRWPRWRMPRFRLPRLRLPRFRRTRKSKAAKAAAEPEPVFAPTVVLADGTLLADRLAAQGRYAEAIRQRLRDIVGDLTAAGVVAPLPGTTAAEVAASAAAHRPAVAGSLGGATDLFSEIWYGDRPALPAHDERMRVLTGDVRLRMREGTP
ncbi:DUF4129 domain-containing protein [Amorphoplanes digitatis]|uniref:Protein-glutamine gamma-glutamyltransferase-like C-terminal domain-containing protein n=1 Tax=Actinoplanes digitatis TaxID=1868 RepID=A0A7W7I3W6_9ACTN|nr:DUF4129 domain-containing protein [Actinoplanes digitatis]MBB4765738.1 hypothetical protein [Actinoplanes digitatis]BFE75636.1 hypothetical protein GCM10020092_089370 [Actinoplanes digitatis]GID93470.1 hypothetical protein Adi01nite_28820 [Actinoplanes digitatis]